mmetsp:Transcript_40723/g.135681  ORF Transcript_40723/g.135681 Transcript_40723/m.135681 type:complete len:228 (+) Transcript_40723:370-1053(+)
MCQLGKLPGFVLIGMESQRQPFVRFAHLVLRAVHLQSERLVRLRRAATLLLRQTHAPPQLLEMSSSSRGGVLLLCCRRRLRCLNVWHVSTRRARLLSQPLHLLDRCPHHTLSCPLVCVVETGALAVGGGGASGRGRWWRRSSSLPGRHFTLDTSLALRFELARCRTPGLAGLAWLRCALWMAHVVVFTLTDPRLVGYASPGLQAPSAALDHRAGPATAVGDAWGRSG